MTTLHTRIAISISAETIIRPLVFEPDDNERTGRLAAHLTFPGHDVEINFNYGWQQASAIIANIDHLAEVLAEVRLEVERVGDAAALWLTEVQTSMPVDDEAAAAAIIAGSEPARSAS